VKKLIAAKLRLAFRRVDSCQHLILFRGEHMLTFSSGLVIQEHHAELMRAWNDFFGA
jgi:hypothetical protein